MNTFSILTSRGISLSLLSLLLSVAVYHELKRGRIPNSLTFTGMGIGLLSAASTGGTAGLRSSATGLAIGFGFLFVFYLFRGVGGGDLKLMGAVGALLGEHLVQPAVVYTAILGGALALLLALWGNNVWPRMVLARASGGGRRNIAPMKGPCAARVTVPYGLAIASGSMLAVCLALN